ncbi:hypothetical protein H206_05477 [Candidatus Electrothrix aarhusensis]|uniref:Uncharacterized protein n=1 Tax=Candidatus Electrothrix aarhusensis TaxID=1859131 RepID=A0A3S3R1L5_9BACT|nr:hypothetical protein H206_05477 [Candidatus Electrothrix aarhusensis]
MTTQGVLTILAKYFQTLITELTREPGANPGWARRCNRGQRSHLLECKKLPNHYKWNFTESITFK